MRSWCILFGRETNAKNNENVIVKSTASSSKQYYLLEYLVPGTFLKEPADKKQQKIGGKNWTSYYDVPLYLVHV